MDGGLRATPVDQFNNQVLVKGNVLRHFGNDGIDHGGSWELIQGNLIADALQYINGEHQDGMQEYGYTVTVLNVAIDSNKVFRELDPLINQTLVPFSGYLQCIDDYGATVGHNGLYVTNNVCATAGDTGIHFESVTNGIIANNTVVCDQVPCTTPPGIYLWLPGSNNGVAVLNNISGNFTIANQDPVYAMNNYVTYDGSPGGAVIVYEIQNLSTGVWTAAYGGEGGAPYLWLGSNRMSTQLVSQVFTQAFQPVANGNPAVFDFHIIPGTEAATFGVLNPQLNGAPLTLPNGIVVTAPPNDIDGNPRPTSIQVPETVYTPTTVAVTNNPPAAPVPQPPCQVSDNTVNGVETNTQCVTETILFHLSRGGWLASGSRPGPVAQAPGFTHCRRSRLAPGLAPA